MIYIEIIRASLLLAPSYLTTLKLVNHTNTPRELVSWLFSFLWQFQFTLILWSGAIISGAFDFTATVTDRDMLFLNVPIDVVFGLSLLISYIQTHAKFQHVMAINVILHIVVMSQFMLFEKDYLSSLLYLTILAIIVTGPAHYLQLWSKQDRHIYRRTVLQNTIWVTLLLWLLPSLIFHFTNENWQRFFNRSHTEHIVIIAGLITPAYLIVNALYHFAKFGNGTGFPYDAPKKLVTTGVYRYISNPMQTGIVLTMLIWGMALDSAFVIFSSLVAMLLFVVFKNICNGTFQQCSTDPNWLNYQNITPKWIPKNTTY